MASLGRQAECDHHGAPFGPVGSDAASVLDVSSQMGQFVPHGLLDEVLGVLHQQHGIEPHVILAQVGLARRLSAQVEAHRRHRKSNTQRVRLLHALRNALTCCQPERSGNRRRAGLGEFDFAWKVHAAK